MNPRSEFPLDRTGTLESSEEIKLADPKFSWSNPKNLSGKLATAMPSDKVVLAQRILRKSGKVAKNHRRLRRSSTTKNLIRKSWPRNLAQIHGLYSRGILATISTRKSNTIYDHRKCLRGGVQNSAVYQWPRYWVLFSQFSTVFTTCMVNQTDLESNHWSGSAQSGNGFLASIIPALVFLGAMDRGTFSGKTFLWWLWPLLMGAFASATNDISSDGMYWLLWSPSNKFFCRLRVKFIIDRMITEMVSSSLILQDILEDPTSPPR